ncbi:MAG: peptidase [Ferruginibacter sp.]|nr:peptidase [Ferruginibacter sp.]
MIRILWVLMIFVSWSLMSCSSSQKNFNPNKKIPAVQLQKDFLLLRNILEEKHPSLYWYTPKDSINFYFDKYYSDIKDSMTEQQFAWHILFPLIDKIHCGHTSVGMSKAYGKWAAGRRQATFPLYMKIWNDTMAVTANLNRKDSIFKRGTLITSVNGTRNKELISDMFNYLPEDGQANNVNYIRLSANFPYYHRNIYGISKKYAVTYIDSNGVEQKDSLALHVIPRDSARKDSIVKREKIKLPKERKQNLYRSLNIDSSGKFAVMTVNSFTRGRLRNFFRKSFRELREKNITNLVLDIRSNGGGRVGLSTLLTKYISRTPFKVADTLFSVTQNLRPYTKYFEGGFLNNIELFFISHKSQDGQFHIRHLENKLYEPKKTAYKGEVYVLTNGPTFSAAALFANAVKGQPGIVLLGEETGGGWYGNNGIMIPDVTLPNTKLRVRMPLFRLVQYQHVAKNGSGIVPDIYVGTSYEALIKGEDKKMEVVKEIILKKSEPAIANPVL